LQPAAPVFVYAFSPATGWMISISMAPDAAHRLYAGARHERVYDVACSDGGVPDPNTHRCPDDGARDDSGTGLAVAHLGFTEIAVNVWSWALL